MGDVERDLGQQTGASPDGDRATRASTEPASGLGHSAGIPSADAELEALARDLEEKTRYISIAKNANKAVHWLRKYGPTAVADRTLYFNYRQSFASACNGAPEAATYLEKAALALGVEILSLASRLAQVDLDRVFPASGITAGTDETRHAAQPVGQEPARTPKDTRHDQ